MLDSNQTVGHKYSERTGVRLTVLNLINFDELRFPEKASCITSGLIANHFALYAGSDKTNQVLFGADKSPVFTVDLELQLYVNANIPKEIIIFYDTKSVVC